MSNEVPSEDPIAEATRLADLARESGVSVRLLGGVAIAIAAAGPLHEDLQRVYKDLDFVVAKRDGAKWAQVLESAGYEPDKQFNTLHGSQRLLHYDLRNNKQLDTFVGEFAMCHVLQLERRFPSEGMTLSPVDLLLTKLQIVEVNDKDLVDTIALLDTHEIGERANDLVLRSLIEVVGSDWGWHTTIMDNLQKVVMRIESTGLPNDRKASAKTKAVMLMDAAETCQKSLKWRARAAVGRRMPWYDLPEEVSN